MAIAFNTVLIPVDFSPNTEAAVSKALTLIGADRAVLHLIHIVRFENVLLEYGLTREMASWRQRIREGHPALQVETHIVRGYRVENAIIRQGRRLLPDLIVIGKQQRRGWWRNIRGISPGRVAKKTNCPVLTVRPEREGSGVKVIVIPVGDRWPEEKLEWGILLAKKYRARIHLLAIRNEGQEGQLPAVFLDVYHHLRERLRHPIEFSTSAEPDPAKAALSYAEMVRAELILV